MTAGLLLVLMLAPLPRAAAPNQRAAFLIAVRQAWVGRLMLLRGFPGQNRLSYGPSGRPLTAEGSGPWTLAEVRVGAVGWQGADLLATGERDGLLAREHAFVPVNLGEPVELVIQLGADALDVATVKELTGEIFVGMEELPKVVPVYWRQFAHGTVPPPPGPVSSLRGAGIEPPAALATPKPAYPPAAKRARLTGKVVLSIFVGPDGRAHGIQIVQALGLGLDDAAVQAVRRWRFQPATVAGQAVWVRANIRVNFRLY
ncbi:MAG: energy transducer TonB [Terriglobales bacterium]